LYCNATLAHTQPTAEGKSHQEKYWSTETTRRSTVVGRKSALFFPSGSKTVIPGSVSATFKTEYKSHLIDHSWQPVSSPTVLGEQWSTNDGLKGRK